MMMKLALFLIASCYALVSCDLVELNVMYDFDPVDGNDGKGQLLLVDDFLYGYTSDGGKYGQGNLLRIATNATQFSSFFDFENGNGAGYAPHHASLQFDGEWFYGCTLYGSSSKSDKIDKREVEVSGDGTFFRFKKVGDKLVYETLHSFSGKPDDGKAPHSGVLLDRDSMMIYGTTSNGGSKDQGTIWSYNITDNHYSLLYSFSGESGWNMHARLTFGPRKLMVYGLTRQGGPSDVGAFFSFNLRSLMYTQLMSLSNATGGTARHGYVERIGSRLYALTEKGGAADRGSLLAIDLDGSHFEVLHHFCCARGTRACALSSSHCKFDGCEPYGAPLALDGHLYFTTIGCGGLGHGAIVRYGLASGHTELVASFNKTNGRAPIGTLIADSTNSTMFGIAMDGGHKDVGTIYSLPVPSS